jgi:thymidylate synthase ThyX
VIGRPLLRSLLWMAGTSPRGREAPGLVFALAPELARTILPQNMYTEFIETASLSAYARLCKLRLDPQAQAEIREYATLVSTLVEECFPVSWAALTAPYDS